MISIDILTELEKKIKKEKITSCLIQYENSLVLKYYKNNKMKDKQHKVNSVTKSVLSILVGIAIDRGDLEGVHQPIADFFSNLTDWQKQLTLEHLLTMTPGFDWPEFTSWGGRPMPMINSRDWVRFILERPMVEPSGESMHYNSGCSQMLSAILQKAAGMSLTEYAEAYLFNPLGIKDYTWYSDAKGIVIGGFGLSLKAEDLLKLGRLMLQEGTWNGHKLVSKDWVIESTIPRFHTYNKIGSYGYHWWILTDDDHQPAQPPAYFAMGYGGQYIIVAPKNQLIVTFTSELYNDTFKPLRYFKKCGLQ
ncbi:CubicO group peptidase (beta-lactamase class C family) [Bacillus sp. SLBN-46]|uniref:serine hydrolase domain-containing protein n=1 Tax=Bacillus sp. SLBN-46 TaxID=3042283 RepID=UPI002863D470|nr:serine hydrolase [Bacillus sp. SLBN-46]MDR6121537.1 CubicO group peptidase (beta-lactamase class C family) [Bacillus sp. SLBN-46]